MLRSFIFRFHFVIYWLHYINILYLMTFLLNHIQLHRPRCLKFSLVNFIHDERIIYECMSKKAHTCARAHTHARAPAHTSTHARKHTHTHTDTHTVDGLRLKYYVRFILRYRHSRMLKVPEITMCYILLKMRHKYCLPYILPTFGNP